MLSQSNLSGESEEWPGDYRQATLALISGWTGIDFGQYRPDQVLKYLHTNAIQSAVEAFSTADPNRQWTVEALADWVGIGGFGPLLVGSAETVADELQSGSRKPMSMASIWPTP